MFPQKKFPFYVVVNPSIKFLIPFPVNKTVDDLILMVKRRLHKKLNHRPHTKSKSKSNSNESNMDNNNNSNNKNENIDKNKELENVENTNNDDEHKNESAINDNRNIKIDSLTTMYWVDAQTFKQNHIFVIVRGDEILKNIINTYKQLITANVRMKNFYWFIARSPCKILNIPLLKPCEIRMAPQEIRQKYHRNTPLLYAGFYFHAFIAKKYHEINNQERESMEKYRQTQLHKKHRINSSSLHHPNHHRYKPLNIVNNNNQNNVVIHAIARNNNHNSNVPQFITPSARSEMKRIQKFPHKQHPQYRHSNNNNNNLNRNIHKNSNNHNNNNNNDSKDDDKLYFMPNAPNNAISNLIKITTGSHPPHRQQQSHSHSHSHSASNPVHNINNRQQRRETKNLNSKQPVQQSYENIPSYLQRDFDPNQAYLYKSFDWKYVLLLSFVCRCLNKDRLSSAHRVVLGQTAKFRHLTEKEFQLCLTKSMGLNCNHVKETVKLLKNQNSNNYPNFNRMIVYDCLSHLASDGFEQKRLEIVRICSQFGTVNELSPVEIACIIQMYETEHQLLNVYRHLF